ncbi:BTAD domain-containing putative transcriptional regulator [Actinoplanes sp. CA-142083]|uniref:AfsR/SARP family transcriptional regulator n=1 Tax=Actinoplanes sp. CA-142083 TaxID=3239903 RepID=UPI003D8A22E6
MRVRLLGPVDVTAGGAARSVAGVRRQAVLAALALAAGHVVSTDRLADLVWGDAAPPTAANTLQSHVSYLRRVLGERGAILARPPGYLLDLGNEPTDVAAAERLIDQAAECAEPGRRASLLRAAIELWRGPALADLPGFEREAQRLDQLLLRARRQLVDVRLELGEHAALLGELGELCRQDPLDEEMAGRLMLALYRAGRQADALDAYRQLRATLREDLGIDPGPAVRDLESAILRQDPALDLPAAPVAATVPAQLPLAVATFAGRSREMAELDRLLDEPAAHSVVISAVSGTAGVGKTALAVRWAHRAASRFPDGQLYCDLRGFDPGGQIIHPCDALHGFLTALGIPADRIPDPVESRSALFRSLLAGKRVLVLLDNARDVEQVRPLLPGSPGCLVVVTSRNQLTPLLAIEGARPVTLDVLSTLEARDLVVGRIGRSRAAAEPEAVGEIVESCARLPLALAIACARAAAHPELPLAKLAGELRDAAGPLDALDGGDCGTDLRAVFSWSYRRLDPPAARLFRLLGLLPGPEVTASAAASLAALPLARTRTLLAGLAEAHLITEKTAGRFSAHDLLRAYAAELARLTDRVDALRSAQHRLLDHYTHSAHRAAALVHEPSDPLTLDPPRDGVTLASLADRPDALCWFGAEYPTLVAAIERAGDEGFDAYVWRLALILWDFQDRQGRWHDLSASMANALAAAYRIGDRDAQARIHRRAAVAARRLGRGDDAEGHLRQALARYQELSDRAGEARIVFSLTVLFDQQDRHADALRHARMAFDLHQELGDRRGLASATNAIGWCLSRMGDYEEAAIHCRRALEEHRAIGDEEGEAESLDSLGMVHHHLGEHRQAVADFEGALRMFRQGADRWAQAQVLGHLGDAHLAAGAPEAARGSWREALAILHSLSHRDADAVRAKLDSLR